MSTDVGRPQHLSTQEARQRLEHERKSRLVQLQAIEAGAGPAEADLKSAQTAAIQRVLKEIDAAGQRLLDGTYGTCSSCDTAIPPERLEILPYVRFCVTCQQRSA
jgi:RNA polymerase-binding transcription factor DksA